MATKTKKSRQPSRKPTRRSRAAPPIEVSLLISRLIESHSELTIRGNLFPSKLHVNFELKSAEPLREEEGFRLVFRVSAEVTATADDNGESRLSIVCRWEVHYAAQVEPSEKQMEMVGYSAAHFAWPFLREFVSSVSQKMGAARANLPLLRIDDEKGIMLIPPPPGSA